MQPLVKQSIALLLVFAILGAPCGAPAANDLESHDPQIKAGYMVGDALIARPMGIAATVAGFALFVVASPFALLGGNAGEAWEAMVVYPAKFTFTRPLGHFD